ncbi:MAG: hypothetical protein VX065_05475, partial [Pseudomonadota bacterium]|nr:hypothetical protein [Pseudomonadota bacterium]
LPERVGVCAEDRADPPVEKENSNFCDFFRPANAAYHLSTVTKRLFAAAAFARFFDEDADRITTPTSTAANETDKNDSATKRPVDMLNNLFDIPPKEP